MTVKRMDNVGIVVEDIDAAIEFFTELGLTLEGRMPIEDEWVGRVTGVRGQRVRIPAKSTTCSGAVRGRRREGSPSGRNRLQDCLWMSSRNSEEDFGGAVRSPAALLPVLEGAEILHVRPLSPA